MNQREQQIHQRLVQIQKNKAQLETEERALHQELESLSVKGSSSFTTEEKLKIFNSLFRGRNDIYAYRWEGSDGKAGYAPARSKDKKVLYPLNDQILYRHLSGSQLIGIYPLLKNDHCFFLAMDFDKKSWMLECAAVFKTAEKYKIPAYVERSQSGNGGHIWVFFEEEVTALKARQLGNSLLQKSMLICPDIDFKSYDRMFPNQDCLPKGGFGNLIALPLYKKARLLGNSVFIDKNFTPYEDQWNFLSEVKKVSKECLDSFLEEHGVKNILSLNYSVEEAKLKPWEEAPSRKAAPLDIKHKEIIQLILCEMIYIDKVQVPPVLLKELSKLASFHNPEFYKAQAMRLSTRNIPRIITCFDDIQHYLALPRGCLEGILTIFSEHKIKYSLIDRRNNGKELNTFFHGNLLPSQAESLSELANHDTGVLSAGTAFGKTVAAICMISARKCNCLILVHRTQLIDQWREKISLFLNLSIDSIGLWGQGKRKLTYQIDVATIQSLNKKGVVSDIVGEYGHIVVDECHHVAAFRLEQVLKRAKAKYILGLTATAIRKDGHHPIIFMQCGKIRFQVSEKKAASIRRFEHKVFPRETDLTVNNEEMKITKIYEILTTDADRNEFIIKDLSRVLEHGRTPVVITERKTHLDFFVFRSAMFCENVIALHGGLTPKQLKDRLDKLHNIPFSEPRIIVATGSFIGEGFDYDRLDTLFLTHPLSWKGRLQQYAGRLHRDYMFKQEVQIYDYVDNNIPVFERMYKKRYKGYENLGYSFSTPDLPLYDDELGVYDDE